MTPKLFLTSIIQDGPDKGYGVAVTKEQYKSIGEKPRLCDFNGIKAYQDFIDYKESWLRCLHSLPAFPHLVSPELAARIGVGNWIGEWEEGYEVMTGALQWNNCTKKIYDNIKDERQRRIVLVEVKDGEYYTPKQIAEMSKGDLQQQIKDHIKDYSHLDWDEALTDNELGYLVDLMLTFRYTPSVPYREQEEGKDVPLPSGEKLKAAGMTMNEYLLRLNYDNALKERDDLRAQVKALSAIKKGLETNVTNLMKQIAAPPASVDAPVEDRAKEYVGEEAGDRDQNWYLTEAYNQKDMNEAKYAAFLAGSAYRGKGEGVECDHSYVPIGEYDQNGRFICTKCNHQI